MDQMSFYKIVLLAVVQGVAELLPVSSSAHVILAEKFLGFDPASPDMTFLLVMLHTGTMLAVIGYFWSSWRARYFSSAAAFRTSLRLVVVATVMTGVIGAILMQLIERIALRGAPHAEIEQLFGNRYLMAGGLASAGILIIASGKRAGPASSDGLGTRQSAWIGAVQGLCLPFRGFSRSGATISTGLLLGVERGRMEEFSFALAVVLTPAVIAREGYRLLKAETAASARPDILTLARPGLAGLLCSFIAGWLALRWLSRWLEQGRWHYFGYYCTVAAAAVLLLHG
jgi:undecaprenyl-diphosphatase